MKDENWFGAQRWSSLHEAHVLHGKELMRFGTIFQSRELIDRQASLFPMQAILLSHHGRSDGQIATDVRPKKKGSRSHANPSESIYRSSCGRY